MNLGGGYYSEDELHAAGFRHVGKNVKIHNRASLYVVENMSIGDNVRIDDFTVIIASGSVEIGSFVEICTHCFLGGTFGITIADFCTLAPGVKLFSASDDYSGNMLTNPTTPADLRGGTHGKVTLEKHVIIGAGSIVLPGCTVGIGSSIGALSLVKSSLAPWGIYAGIPVGRKAQRSKKVLELETIVAQRRLDGQKP